MEFIAYESSFTSDIPSFCCKILVDKSSRSLSSQWQDGIILTCVTKQVSELLAVWRNLPRGSRVPGTAVVQKGVRGTCCVLFSGLRTGAIAPLIHDITAWRVPTRKSHYWLMPKQWPASNWLQRRHKITLYYRHSDYTHRSKRVERINVKGTWLQKIKLPKKEESRKTAKGQKIFAWCGNCFKMSY